MYSSSLVSEEIFHKICGKLEDIHRIFKVNFNDL